MPSSPIPKSPLYRQLPIKFVHFKVKKTPKFKQIYESFHQAMMKFQKNSKISKTQKHQKDSKNTKRLDILNRLIMLFCVYDKIS